MHCFTCGNFHFVREAGGMFRLPCQICEGGQAAACERSRANHAPHKSSWERHMVQMCKQATAMHPLWVAGVLIEGPLELLSDNLKFGQRVLVPLLETSCARLFSSAAGHTCSGLGGQLTRTKSCKAAEDRVLQRSAPSDKRAVWTSLQRRANTCRKDRPSRRPGWSPTAETDRRCGSHGHTCRIRLFCPRGDRLDTARN